MDPSEELKKIREDFKQAQNRFVEEQKELRQKLKEATDDDRARIRTEMQTKRQSFIDQPSAKSRSQIRELANDLKDKLKDHRDIVDAAKEEAKDKTKGRKGEAINKFFKTRHGGRELFVALPLLTARAASPRNPRSRYSGRVFTRSPVSISRSSPGTNVGAARPDPRSIQTDIPPAGALPKRSSVACR